MAPRFLLAAALFAILPLAPLGAAEGPPIAGTWRAVQAGQSVEIILTADGAYARRDAGPGALPMTVTGRWTANPAEPWLHVRIDDWSPRRACGLVGCTPIRMRQGETYRFILQGEDRLWLEDSGGRIELQRAG
jgi:hypothetical protein